MAQIMTVDDLSEGTTHSSFVCYDAFGQIGLTGITQIVTLGAWPVPEGETMALVDEPIDGSSHYVKDGVLTERPEMILDKAPGTFRIDPDGTDTFTLSGIPASALITVLSTTINHTTMSGDGTFSFDTDVPGRYKIEIFDFPSKTSIYEVEAFFDET